MVPCASTAVGEGEGVAEGVPDGGLAEISAPIDREGSTTVGERLAAAALVGWGVAAGVPFAWVGVGVATEVASIGAAVAVAVAAGVVAVAVGVPCPVSTLLVGVSSTEVGTAAEVAAAADTGLAVGSSVGVAVAVTVVAGVGAALATLGSDPSSMAESSTNATQPRTARGRKPARGADA